MKQYNFFKIIKTTTEKNDYISINISCNNQIFCIKKLEQATAVQIIKLLKTLNFEELN